MKRIILACTGIYLFQAVMRLFAPAVVGLMQEWLARIPDYRIAAGVNLTERGGQLRIQHLPLEWG